MRPQAGRRPGASRRPRRGDRRAREGSDPTGLTPASGATARAYVGLGANVGPRATTIQRAVNLLGGEPGIRLVELSTLRETEPVGSVDQPSFLNGVVALDTTLSPGELLDRLLRIERELGRRRDGERWGPRTIDLDLLVHGSEVVDEPGLHVPHPRLHERRFALEPLAELDPDLEIPGRGIVSEIVERLPSI